MLGALGRVWVAALSSDLPGSWKRVVFGLWVCRVLLFGNRVTENNMSGADRTAFSFIPVIQVSVLGGSLFLVSKVISTLIGVINNYKYSYLIYNPTY